MTKILCLIYLVVFHSVLSAAAVGSKYENGLDINNSKDHDDKMKGMWFRPTLGRKKRSEYIEHPKSLQENKIKELLNSLNDNQWAIVTVNGNEAKRNTYSFTPRLGRTLEDVGRWNGDESDLVERSSPFAPRLGRRVNPYSPRLGRNEKFTYIPEI